jgi:anti-anti-sigma factor
MPQVAITDTIEQDALVITLTGDLDILTAPACADRLAEAMADRRPGCALVALDMRHVDFCGSVGLRVLTAFAQDCADQGLNVCVITVPLGPVHRLLQLTRLDTVLPVFHHLADAVAHYR